MAAVQTHLRQECTKSLRKFPWVCWHTRMIHDYLPRYSLDFPYDQVQNNVVVWPCVKWELTWQLDIWKALKPEASMRPEQRLAKDRDGETWKWPWEAAPTSRLSKESNQAPPSRFNPRRIAVNLNFVKINMDTSLNCEKFRPLLPNLIPMYLE